MLIKSVDTIHYIFFLVICKTVQKEEKRTWELVHPLVIANSVHQQKNDVFVQGEEIQALNLMLFDFISVMDETEKNPNNEEIIENIKGVVKTKEFVPTVFDEKGNTLLMKAVLLGNLQLIELLCEFGVDC